MKKNVNRRKNEVEIDFEIPNVIIVTMTIFLTQIKLWMMMTLQFTNFDFGDIFSHFLNLHINLMMLQNYFQVHFPEIKSLCLIKWHCKIIHFPSLFIRVLVSRKFFWDNRKLCNYIYNLYNLYLLLYSRKN